MGIRRSLTRKSVKFLRWHGGRCALSWNSHPRCRAASARLPRGVSSMQAPEVNRPVRLLKDIPELGLRSGEVGVVCSTWFAPTPAYEVEFERRGHATRALVMRSMIQPADDLTDRPNN